MISFDRNDRMLYYLTHKNNQTNEEIMKPKTKTKEIRLLPKKFSMKFSSYSWVYNDRFISNGHFMIPRKLVRDDSKYCIDIPRAKREDLERLIPRKEDARFVYKKTNRLFDNGHFLVREFECLDHFSEEGRHAYLNEEYVKFFEINYINGTNQLNAFICFETNLVIMPCRKPE